MRKDKLKLILRMDFDKYIRKNFMKDNCENCNSNENLHLHHVYKFSVQLERALDILKYSDKEKVNLPEVKLLIRIANLDMKKVNYKKLLKQISLMFSILLPITVIAIEFVKSIFLKILLGAFLLTLLTYLGICIIKTYYKNRGMIKDE